MTITVAGSVGPTEAGAGFKEYLASGESFEDLDLTRDTSPMRDVET